jgi:hypothetical protein
MNRLVCILRSQPASRRRRLRPRSNALTSSDLMSLSSWRMIWAVAT